MKKKFYTMLVLSCLPAAVLFAGGCRRSELNYQIAESIGTVGKYDNNEPVESPKMREERLAQEAVSEEAVQTRSILDQADALAASYRYDEAIEYLQSVSTEGNSEELTNKINEYQNEQASLSAYDGAIPHLCFPTLIEDTSMAFDGDENSSNYANSMITVREFEAMLESLYEKGYVLVSMSDIAKDVTDSRGVTTLEMQQIMLPADKKPIVLSQDNVSYEGVKNGDGIATCLVLDDDGRVKAKYTDSEGHDKIGDYDFIPIVDSFVEQHPDFSYKGAKGVISVSGANGVYGYSLSKSSSGPASQTSSETEGTAQAQTSAASTAQGTSDSTAGTQSGETSADSSTNASGETGTPDNSRVLNLHTNLQNQNLTEEQKTIAGISDALRDDGWSIACAGYSHSYMNDMSLSQLENDISSWEEEVGSLVGGSSILFYPYGGEVAYPGDQLNYLLSSGFEYLCGLWGDTDYMEMGDGYLRQTRRFVDGYTLENAPDYFTDFFDVSSLRDPDR